VIAGSCAHFVEKMLKFCMSKKVEGRNGGLSDLALILLKNVEILQVAEIEDRKMAACVILRSYE
jgi:predicted nucleic acid-binding protein